MNERIRAILNQAREEAGAELGYYSSKAEQKFAELIVKEHVKLLQQQWYDLNNAPAVEDESPRDIGIRVGRKGEIITLMAKIKEHFGVKE